jgi:hypothetical protein
MPLWQGAVYGEAQNRGAAMKIIARFGKISMGGLLNRGKEIGFGLCLAVFGDVDPYCIDIILGARADDKTGASRSRRSPLPLALC